MNICIFPGQGKNTFVFDELSNPYFQEMEQVINIKKNDLLKNDYPFKYQLLTMIYSLSKIEKIKQIDNDFYKKIDTLMGYSLGEYSALVWGGSISFKECILLVKKRSELMYNCSLKNESGLIVIIGIKRDFLKIIFKDIKYYISIYLSQDGFVCSIKNVDIEVVIKKLNNLKKLNKIFYKRLEVDGGFHSPFMEECVIPFKNYLKNIDFKEPKIKMVSNYDGEIYRNTDEIKKKLVLHLTHPIRWDNIIKKHAKEVHNIYEIGGNQLKKTLMLNNIDISNYKFIE